MTTNATNADQGGALAPAEKQEPEHVPGSPRKVPAALIEAIRAELLALAEGDLEENLKPISDVVLRANELFVAIRGAEARALRGTPVPMGMGMNASVTSFSGSGSMGMVSPVSYSNPEQFGASAIRQLVSLVPEILAARTNAPDKLMKAIAIAKKEGHTEIAEVLTKRLLGDEAPEHEHEHEHEHGDKPNGKKNGIARLPEATP